MFALRSALIIWILLFSSQAFATRIWIPNVRVESIAEYFKSGTNVTTILFAPVQGTTYTNTGCAPTDNHHIASWKNGSITPGQQNMLAVLLAAQSQGLPVDLLVETSTCHTISGWGLFGDGLGIDLWGVRIKSETDTVTSGDNKTNV